MADLKQSTATNRMVLMVDSADHVTGKTGLSLTITSSKAGGAFASTTPTVTERGSGWYSLALATSDTDTVGDLVLHVTGAGADPTDLRHNVVAGSLDADVSSRSTFAGGAVASVTAAVTSTIADGSLTAAKFAANALAAQPVASVTAPVTTTVADGSLTAAKFGANALLSQPVASVANLALLQLSGGAVSASPAATSSTFTATGNLNTTPGGYTSAPMSIFWQSGANAGFKYAILVHSVSGSSHAFTVGPAMANVPASNDMFVIG